MISWQRSRPSGSGVLCSHMPGLYDQECFRKGPSSGIFDGIPGIASLPTDAAQVDPVEDHHQVRRLDLDPFRCAFHRRGREAEAAFFQPFVPKAISVPVPPQDLDPITATTPEDEEMSRERVKGHGGFDEV